ncbi:DNA-binding protein [Tanacetum coccineum]
MRDMLFAFERFYQLLCVALAVAMMISLIHDVLFHGVPTTTRQPRSCCFFGIHWNRRCLAAMLDGTGADPELEAIRQRRMQEMMAQHGGGGSQQNPEQQKAQEEAKSEADERRQMMLSQILSSQARERRK